MGIEGSFLLFVDRKGLMTLVRAHITPSMSADDDKLHGLLISIFVSRSLHSATRRPSKLKQKKEGGEIIWCEMGHRTRQYDIYRGLFSTFASTNNTSSAHLGSISPLFRLKYLIPKWQQPATPQEISKPGLANRKIPRRIKAPSFPEVARTLSPKLTTACYVNSAILRPSVSVASLLPLLSSAWSTSMRGVSPFLISSLELVL